MRNIPDKFKNNCPKDHSTYEKFTECDCNFGLAREIWYFKEQQLQQKEERLSKAERVIKIAQHISSEDEADIVMDYADTYFKQKQETLKTEKEDV